MVRTKKKAKPKEQPDVIGRGRRNRDQVAPGHVDATVERLLHAGREGASVDPQGIRRLADPFDILRAKGLLDRTNTAMNDVLWHAGDKYRGYWHRAGLNGLAAMDLTRDIVDGGTGAGGLASSEHAAFARQKVREANAVIGPRHAALFCAIVLHGQSIGSQRHLVGDTDRDKTADALTLDRLREVLHRLCDLWGMKPNDRSRMSSWRG